MTDARLHNLDRARYYLRTLLDAAETLANYDDLVALDTRDHALRRLAGFGVSYDALEWISRMSHRQVASIVAGARPADVGTRQHLTACLVAIAAGSPHPPPPR